jgi:hypothetical protein
VRFGIWIKLLLGQFAGYSSLSVYLKSLCQPSAAAEENASAHSGPAPSQRLDLTMDHRARGTPIDLHKEWCNEIFVFRSLEFDLVIRATIKPAYQRRFSIHQGFALWLTLSFLFAMGSPRTVAEVSSNWS